MGAFERTFETKLAPVSEPSEVPDLLLTAAIAVEAVRTIAIIAEMVFFMFPPGSIKLLVTDVMSSSHAKSKSPRITPGASVCLCLKLA